MKNSKKNKKNKTKMLLKLKNLDRKRHCSQPFVFGPPSKLGARPAYSTRMGSKPSNQRLGRQSSPATPPAWAQFSPRGCHVISTVDHQI
jgi:hypothetical protein